MFNYKTFLVTLALFILSIYFPKYILAEEFENNLGVSEFKNKAKIIKPPDVSKINLKKIKKVAVLVTSTSPLFGGVAEDQLSVKLRDLGFDVVQRSKISDLTQNELMKGELRKLEEELKIVKEQIELEKRLEKEEENSKKLKRIEKQLEQLKKVGENPQKESLNIIEVGKKLGLDAVLMGTLFEGRRQIGFSEEKPPMSVEKMIVATFHLQVIDTLTEKTVLSVMLEYDKGENITKAIDDLTKIILKEIKG